MILRLPDSRSNWRLEMLVFEERGNRSTRRKTSRSKGKNQQEITYAAVKKKNEKIGKPNFFQSFFSQLQKLFLYLL